MPWEDAVILPWLSFFRFKLCYNMETEELKTKVYLHCRQEKPVSEFYPSTVTKDGYRPQCIECAKQSAKEASLRHRAKKHSERENAKAMNTRPLTVTEKKELLEKLRSDKPLSAYHPRELFEYLASIGYKITAEYTQKLSFG